MKKLLYLLTIFLCVNYQVFAQNNEERDSLIQVLKHDISDIEKVDIYNRILMDYAYSIQDSSQLIHYISHTLQLAQTLNQKDKLIDAHLAVSFGYIQLNKLDSASLFLTNLLAQSYEYQQVLGFVYKGLAQISYQKNQISQGDKYAFKSIEGFSNIDNQLEIGLIYGDLGTRYGHRGEYEKAYEYYEKAIQVYTKLNRQDLLGDTYLSSAFTFLFQGNNPQSLTCYQNAIRAYSEANNETGLATAYQNLAYFYSTKDYEKALFNYQKSAKIHKKLHDYQLIARAYNDMADVYIYKGEYEKALQYAQKALKISSTHPHQDQYWVTALSHAKIGMAYTYLKKYEQSEIELKISLNLYKKIADIPMVGYLNKDLGKLYVEQKSYKKAIIYLNEALQISKEVQRSRMFKDGTYYLSQAYEGIGNYKLAYQNHLLFIEMRDSLENEESTKKIARSEVEFEFQKEKDSLHFNREKERIFFQQETEKQEIKQRNTLAGLGLVSVLVLVTFYFLWDKQKNNQKLAIINAQLSETNEELNTAHEEVKATNSEVNFINNTLQKTLITSQEQKKNILDSINYAQRIQQAIFPSERRLKSAFPEHFILFRSRDVVSGDFYWLGDVQKDEKVIIGAIDCTGHGVPGAFMSMVGNDLLNHIVNWEHVTDSDKILNLMHQKVRQSLNQQETENRDGMDVALVVWDKRKNILQFSGAKNPLIYIQNGEIHHIKGDRKTVGGRQREAQRKFTKHEIPITSPITFYIFTDGFQDQFGGEKNLKFMNRRFRQLLFDVHQLPMSDQKNKLDNVLDDWMKNQKQIDDILVIGAKIG